MKFIPWQNSVEIEPLVKKNLILSDRAELIEAGKVIQIGTRVDEAIKLGDTLHFEAYGVFQTQKDVDGEVHYVVQIADQFIRGISRDGE